MWGSPHNESIQNKHGTELHNGNTARLQRDLLSIQHKQTRDADLQLLLFREQALQFITRADSYHQLLRSRRIGGDGAGGQGIGVHHDVLGSRELVLTAW